MRRPYTLTLSAITLPGAVHSGNLGGGGGSNARKLHFAGLGDGHVDTQQGLRGAGNKRRRKGGRVSIGDNQHAEDVQSPFYRDVARQSPRQEYNTYSHNPNNNRKAAANAVAEDNVDDDANAMDYLRKGADRRAALAYRDEANLHSVGGEGGGIRSHNNPQSQALTTTSDGPWQLSVLMLLGIMGVLMGLFVHFSTDPTTTSHHASYYFRRRKKKPHFHSPSYKKKTDEWSEDEEVTEDDHYRGDTEGGVGGAGGVGGGSIAKKRSPIPSPIPKAPDDPSARLYYQLNTADNFRQQESRLRKSINKEQQQQQQQMTNVGTSTTTSSSRNRAESTLPTTFHTPSRSSTRSSTLSGTVDKTTKTKTTSSSSPFPSPPFRADRDNSGIGSGLEGFSCSSSFDSDGIGIGSNSRTDSPAINKAHPLVKPMGTFTPTESFASLGHRDSVASNTSSSRGSNAVGEVDFNTTPPISAEEQVGVKGTTYLPVSSPRQSNQYSQKLSELPTPRVDHTRGKRDLARAAMMKDNKGGPKQQLGGGVPLSGIGTPENAAAAAAAAAAMEGPLDYRRNMDLPKNNDATIKTPDITDAFPGLPLVPSLNDGSITTTGESSSSSFHLDAPRSVLLEELQLVRMESGVSGPRWRTKYELEQNEARIEERRQETENMEKLREASAAVDPADDPRNSIQHIRKDLTISSDASSSLSSKIAFSELKLEDVIGGGGFGQVWRARWKGTPVAVKVLTGSAQAETVPKAVLEEFIAEINMVSGMRHPNICLFMGACLEPPNRAIVTELCENGSLWDALRSPLSMYQVADGRTRLAWPLDIYEPMTLPPPTFRDGRHVVPSSTIIDPPLAPGGAWPWVLVKRVAAGTARGMCYLHSGNPPVLHRDLKSANILLDESYTAKLADFGLSRLKAVRSGMTGNCGTVQWMAPEVLCNEAYAEPADVFSFGIILWEMLTKECPYDGMTPIQCALSVLNENKRPEIPDWCPQSLRALIKNCLERDPHSRPTFTQILSALDALP